MDYGDCCLSQQHKLSKSMCELHIADLEHVQKLTDGFQILINEGQCDDYFGDEDEDGESDNTEAWTDQDREMVTPIKGLVKTASKLLKKATEATKAKAKCDSEDNIAQLDDLCDCVERLSPAVDNLTSGLYVPVDRTAVKNYVSTLVTGVCFNIEYLDCYWWLI